MNLIVSRSLAALAVFGAALPAAQAQSSVTLFGLVDLSIGSNKAPGGERTNNVDSGKMTTSHFGFRGSEDLGGGLAAVFRLEHFMRSDTGEAGRFPGDAFFARNATVGLTHTAAGSLTIGRNTTPLFVATVNFNAFGDSYGYSPAIRHVFTSGTVSGDSGWNDSAQFQSASFGGFRLGLIGALGEGSNGRNWGVNAGYTGGAFAASLVVQDVEKGGAAAVADTRTTQLAASYDFGAAKVFGQLAKVDNRSVVNEYRLANLGVRVPVGGGALLAQWGRISPDTGADRGTLSIGYDHHLSKRTDVYLVGMRDKIDGLSAGSSVSAGVRHRF